MIKGSQPGRLSGVLPFRWDAQSGFTLIELIITIAIIVIVMKIAIPELQNTVLAGKLSSYANNLAASAHLARSEAIKRNSVVSLCVSADGASCGTGDWEQGWIVVAADGSVLQHQQALKTGLKFIETDGKTSIGFRPSGVGNNSAATLKVCQATPSVGAFEREVRISITGRPTVVKTESGSCS